MNKNNLGAAYNTALEVCIVLVSCYDLVLDDTTHTPPGFQRSNPLEYGLMWKSK